MSDAVISGKVAEAVYKNAAETFPGLYMTIRTTSNTALC